MQRERLREKLPDRLSQDGSISTRLVFSTSSSKFITKYSRCDHVSDGNRHYPSDMAEKTDPVRAL